MIPKSIKNKSSLNPLIGKWEYKDCTIKNTAVYGSITFKEDGTFFAKVKMREDHPTPDLSLVEGNYKISGNQVKSSDIKHDNDWYRPTPFSRFFLIEGDFLYFSNISISKAERDRDRAKWTYKLINSKLENAFIKEYKNPLISDHTPSKPYHIPGLRIYFIDDMERFRKNLPQLHYIVDSSYSAFKSSEIFNVLKKMNYYPKSKEEAVNSAVFIFKSEPRGCYVFIDYTPEELNNWKNKSKIQDFDWNNLLKPFVSKKEDYFEILLYGYAVSPDRLFKFTIKLGKGIYELIKEVLN